MASTFTVWSRRERRATTFTSAFETLASAYHFLAGQRRKSQFVGELLAAARGRRMTQQQIAWLHKIATDDLEAARAYAKETGNCSFCHRELTDAPSVFAGYGPVCAAKRGLPWGEVGEVEDAGEQDDTRELEFEFAAEAGDLHYQIEGDRR